MKLLLTLLFPTLVSAIPDLDLSFSHPPQAKVGSIINVDVKMSNIGSEPSSWVASQLIFTWNPEVLKLVGHTECDAPSNWEYFAVFFPGGGLNELINQGITDGIPGNDGDAFLGILGPLGHVNDVSSGSYTLTSLEFEVIGTGKSEFTFIDSFDTGIPCQPGTTCYPGTIVLETDIGSFDDNGIDNDVLGNLGTSQFTGISSADVNGDGSIDIEDLLSVLTNWTTN